ncbi:hypothetical protein Hanom_Chr04g00335281 [Helianthus anomalus]
MEQQAPQTDPLIAPHIKNGRTGGSKQTDTSNAILQVYVSTCMVVVSFLSLYLVHM